MSLKEMEIKLVDLKKWTCNHTHLVLFSDFLLKFVNAHSAGHFNVLQEHEKQFRLILHIFLFLPLICPFLLSVYLLMTFPFSFFFLALSPSFLSFPLFSAFLFPFFLPFFITVCFFLPFLFFLSSNAVPLPDLTITLISNIVEISSITLNWKMSWCIIVVLGPIPLA